MAEDTLNILRVSKEPRELVLAAERLAASREPADHQALLGFLKSREFLERLDSRDDCEGDWRRLRLRRVLEILRGNTTPSARAALVSLTQAPPYVQDPPRSDLLIPLFAEVRPAPPELVAYWDEHSLPDDGWVHLTMKAIVDNGSPPAIALLERKMADTRFSDEDKIDWLHTCILTHRNDLPLLQACERMLGGSLPEHLRPSLVEVLFDYRREWFRASAPLRAPLWPEASPEAKAQLRKIGEAALDPIQRSAVEKTLQEMKAAQTKE
jgi:hypothetical protein